MVLPGYITVCTGSNLRLQFPEFLSEHWCVEKKQVLGAIWPVCHWLLEGGRCGPAKSSHRKVASELTLSDVAIETLLLASEGSKVDVDPGTMSKTARGFFALLLKRLPCSYYCFPVALRLTHQHGISPPLHHHVV